MPNLPSPTSSKNTLPDRPRLKPGINLLGMNGARQHSMRTELSDGTWNDANRIYVLNETEKKGTRAPDSLLYKETSMTQMAGDYRDGTETPTSGGDRQLTETAIVPTKSASMLEQQIKDIEIPETTVTAPTVAAQLGVAGAGSVSSGGGSNDDDEEERNHESSTVGGITRPPNSGPSEY